MIRPSWAGWAEAGLAGPGRPKENLDFPSEELAFPTGKLNFPWEILDFHQEKLEDELDFIKQDNMIFFSAPGLITLITITVGGGGAGSRHGAPNVCVFVIK